MASVVVSGKKREVVIGKRKISADEFAFIATGESIDLQINTACAEELDTAAKKRFPPIDVDKIRVAYDATKGHLDRSAARGVLLMRALSFLQNRAAVRSAVVEALVDLLNRDLVPVLPAFPATDAEIMTAVADIFPAAGRTQPLFFAGSNAAVQKPLSELAPDVALPELNANEIKRTIIGVNASQAVFVIAAARASALSKVHDAVAVLSLEAANAFTEPFQQAYYDVARPHLGAMEVAAVLRALLDGSTCVNKAKRKTQDPAALREIPLFSAALRGAAAASLSAARVEANSAEAPGTQLDWQHDPAFTGVPILQSVAALTAAAARATRAAYARAAAVVALTKEAGVADLVTAAAGADARAAELAKLDADVHAAAAAAVSAEAAAPCEEQPVPAAAARAQAVCATLAAALATEASVALFVLGARNASAVESSAKALAVKREATLKRIADWEALDAKAVAEGTARPDPKKCPPRPKDDDASAAAGKGIVLGAGSQKVWQVLLSYSPDGSTLTDPALVERLIAATAIVNQTAIPKLPKGTRDTDPALMAVRERAFNLITEVFQAHGAVGIDTPVFERKEILTGKYGEDSKLIYDLAPQGGEILSLRYDLTVPFARYCAANGVTNIKRYHIAKVYRRDNPVMAKGRFREFFQCDYDIAGVYPSMVPDAETLKVMSDVLAKLDLGNFKIKLSHRKLLDAIMIVCGVPVDSVRAICSAVDKLDKEPWSAVRDEMIHEKGLPPAVADKLEQYVTIPPSAVPGDETPTGSGMTALELLARLEADAALAASPAATEAFTDLRTLFGYLDAMNGLTRISLDMSLARGLDYYTGVIYEAVFLDKNQVGSVAAGGRYDGLLGMFSGKHVPAVGMSIGIERILAILEQKARAQQKTVKTTKTTVLVASVGNDMLLQRMKLAAELWAAGIPTEFLYAENPNIRKQMEYAFEGQIPLIAWLGEDEIAQGVVTVKTLAEDKDAQTEARSVPRASIVEGLRTIIASLPTDALGTVAVAAAAPVAPESQ